MLQQGRPRRFFWFVLTLASLASIAGNGAHSWVSSDLMVPRQMAIAVAVAPPVVLMLSIEGLSLLVRSLRRSAVTFWCTVAMTVFLAAGAFVLSFEALRDLAVRNGIPAQLAWIWPMIIDVTIAQATLALVTLSHPDPVDLATETELVPTQEAATSESAPRTDRRDRELEFAGVCELAEADDAGYERLAEDVLRARRIRQSPETVKQVLAMGEDGVKVNEIASRTDLHHSTVRRILGAAQMAEAR
jgi:hypothetical protein